MTKKNLIGILALTTFAIGAGVFVTKLDKEDYHNKCLAVSAGLKSDSHKHYSHLPTNTVIDSVYTNTDDYCINYHENGKMKSVKLSKKSLAPSTGWHTSM